jgi:hypothetical protein
MIRTLTQKTEKDIRVRDRETVFSVDKDKKLGARNDKAKSRMLIRDWQG